MKITITLTDNALHWVRGKAAKQKTSVSKLIGRMLEHEMTRDDEYWRAYKQWQQVDLIEGINAAGRLSRDEAHER